MKFLGLHKETGKWVHLIETDEDLEEMLEAINLASDRMVYSCGVIIRFTDFSAFKFEGE